MKKVVVLVVAFSMLFVAVPTESDAGVIAGVATEWTQILNHVQLIQSYIRQGLQLANEMKHYQLALKESLIQPNQVFGVIQQDLGQLAQLVQGGRALAYSTANNYKANRPFLPPCARNRPVPVARFKRSK